MALLGPSLARIPLPIVQLVVGTLLLTFGLHWLRKAILRAAGVLALHDEAKTFAEESEALRGAGRGEGAIDKAAFGAAFKIDMSEGIEVVFIVIAIGAGGPLLVPASLSAGLALLVVVALGLIVHGPLAKVPEYSLTFGVGVLLSACGSFWVGEGIGLAWPGEDWAILALIALYLVVALTLVSGCRNCTAKKQSGPRARPAMTAAKRLLSARSASSCPSSGGCSWTTSGLPSACLSSLPVPGPSRQATQARCPRSVSCWHWIECCPGVQRLAPSADVIESPRAYTAVGL